MNKEIPTYKFALRKDLNDKKYLPTQSEPLATGWDVCAAPKEELRIRPGAWVKIPLGIRCYSPGGWWLELRPRSSTAGKKNMHALYGVIDETYEGELIFCAQYLPDRFIDMLNVDMQQDPDPNNKLPKANLENNGDWLTIGKGEKIGQLVPIKRQEMNVEEVSNEEFDELCKQRGAARGAGGFGSTGK